MRKILIPLVLSLFATAVTAQSNVRYYKDTGRQVTEINSQYPYDISILSPSNDTLNSADIFKENGKPTILLFWLTTCAPCRAELAAISKKYENWQQEADFNLYAVSLDWPRNAEQFISRVAQSNWPFAAYRDVNREFGKIMPGNLNGLPQVFVLNKGGEIVHHKRKYRPGDEDQLFEWVKEL